MSEETRKQFKVYELLRRTDTNNFEEKNWIDINRLLDQYI